MAKNPYKDIPYVVRYILQRELSELERVEENRYREIGSEVAKDNAEYYSEQLELVRESMGR